MSAFSRPFRRQQGLSLVELLISLGLGAFMLVGIISLVASVSQTRNQLARTSEQIENGRYALQLFSEDVSLAGFLGRYHPGVGVASYTLPDPCLDGSDTTKLGFKSDLSAPELPAAIEGFATGESLPACLQAASAVSDSEVLVVRRVNTTEAAVASMGAGPHLQISACDGDAANFVFSADKSKFILRNKDCASVAPVWSYMTRAYFITPCDDCGDDGDSIPTLKLREFAGGVISTRSLVNGVEDVHYQYGLDLDMDGSPDCYVANPAAATAPASCAASGWSANAAENWANVVSLEVRLLVRGVETSMSEVLEKTYDLGRADRVGPFDDYHRRQVYSSVLMLPNVAGARE